MRVDLQVMGTLGAQKLRKYLQKHKQQDLAEKLSDKLGRKVYQASVSAIANEKYVPGSQIIVALKSVVGIKLEDWITPADESEVPPGGRDAA